jgi:HPt (histidine-containing phosphotransfer) domain-containing protein
MPNTNYWLEGLAEQLNPQQLGHFLQKAIPELQQDYQLLDQALDQADWAVASKTAHKLGSLSKLLGMQAMSHYLLKITEAPSEQLQTAAFRLKLQKAYTQDLRLLEQRKQAACDA